MSEIDFEEQAPQPALVETHSPAESEASVNMKTETLFLTFVDSS